MSKLSLLPYNFNFEIIKINKKTNNITFISSSDWNAAREPEVGDAYRINGFKLKFIKSKGQIYHHKWMFVGDNYKGFNIEESKKWSEQWQNIIPKTKEIKSRIGYKKYWIEILKDFNLPLDI